MKADLVNELNIQESKNSIAMNVNEEAYRNEPITRSCGTPYIHALYTT